MQGGLSQGKQKCKHGGTSRGSVLTGRLAGQQRGTPVGERRGRGGRRGQVWADLCVLHWRLRFADSARGRETSESLCDKSDSRF